MPVEPKIQVKVGGKELSFPAGVTVGQVIKQIAGTSTFPPLGVLRGHRPLDPDLPLVEDCSLQPVNYGDFVGMTIYRRTAALILVEAVHRLFPGRRLVIGHTLANGYYCDLHLDRPLTSADISKIEKEMLRIVKADLPVLRTNYSLDEARDLFTATGFSDKITLLDHFPAGDEVCLVGCGECLEFHLGPMAPSTGLIRTFSLTSYREGFILRFPPQSDVQRFPTWAKGWNAPVTQKAIKLFRIYRESQKQSVALGVRNVGKLNEAIDLGRAGELIAAAEEIQKREIDVIASAVARREAEIRFLIVGGPCASGKTALSRRLLQALERLGISGFELALDNYRLDLGDLPREEDGMVDLDSLQSLDLPLINAHLDRLSQGATIEPPRFDYTQGRRTWETSGPLQLVKPAVLIVHGTQALNDQVAPRLPARCKFKVYVSALAQISIDDHSRIFTADTRLLRSIVRGRRRGRRSSRDSLRRWPLARRAENREVFPYQDRASVMFNSALIYEHGVLKQEAEAGLAEIGPEHPEYAEAQRLLIFLSFFRPIPEMEVPDDSLLREFLG